MDAVLYMHLIRTQHTHVYITNAMFNFENSLIKNKHRHFISSHWCAIIRNLRTKCVQKRKCTRKE